MHDGIGMKDGGWSMDVPQMPMCNSERNKRNQNRNRILTTIASMHIEICSMQHAAPQTNQTYMHQTDYGTLIKSRITNYNWLVTHNRMAMRHLRTHAITHCTINNIIRSAIRFEYRRRSIYYNIFPKTPNQRNSNGVQYEGQKKSDSIAIACENDEQFHQQGGRREKRKKKKRINKFQWLKMQEQRSEMEIQRAEETKLIQIDCFCCSYFVYYSMLNAHTQIQTLRWLIVVDGTNRMQ